MKYYYAARAEEYDRIYQKPERQNDLASLRQHLPGIFRNRNVLEIACGTGYWTQYLADAASTITAVDYNDTVLRIAQQRLAEQSSVTFICEDAKRLASVAQCFNAAFAGFWYSHLRQNEISSFYSALHRCLLPGSLVVMLDNRFVAGSSTPISHTDENGDSWQLRTLQQTGEQFEIVKNFPDCKQFEYRLPQGCVDVEFVELEYYWYARYRLAG